MRNCFLLPHSRDFLERTIPLTASTLRVRGQQCDLGLHTGTQSVPVSRGQMEEGGALDFVHVHNSNECSGNKDTDIGRVGLGLNCSGNLKDNSG